jgi:hypothetical protein
MATVSHSINHVAFAVTDMARAKQILIDCFGLVERIERRVDNGGMSVTMIAANSVDIELLYLNDPDERPLLHALTPHLAIDVIDLESAVSDLGEKGVQLQNYEPTHVLGTWNVWTTAESTAGLVIQLVMRSAEPRTPQASTRGANAHR